MRICHLDAGRKIILFLIFLLFSPNLRAESKTEQSRPVTGVYSVEIGWQNVYASYLSPLHYKGKRLALSGEWSKAMPFNAEHAIMKFKGNGDFSNLLNPAQTARMIGLQGNFSWGLEWRKRLPLQFQVTAGGAAEIGGGAYYLLRNGNNPVQALAHASLNITGSVSKVISLGKLPVIVADEISLPSFGVFFNQGYGETYFEIYLGNHKGLAHCGWWGNNFCLDNLLSLKFDFGRTAAELGYRFNAYTQWANNLNTKIITHSIVIGVIPGGLGLKKKRILPVETVYSVY